jgi:hypothetical protein
MKKMLLVLAAVFFGGCGYDNTWYSNRPTYTFDPNPATNPSTAQSYSRLEKRQQDNLEWRQDWVKFRQDVNDWSAESNSITEQEYALLMTLDDKADFQLYKDFLLYIEPSEDQIKTLEFIERMRAALPLDEMKKIEALYSQYRDCKLKGNLLQNREVALKERARENLRRGEADTAAAEAAMHR